MGQRQQSRCVPGGIRLPQFGELRPRNVEVLVDEVPEEAGIAASRPESAKTVKLRGIEHVARWTGTRGLSLRGCPSAGNPAVQHRLEVAFLDRL